MVVIGINEKLSRHGIRINLNFSFSVSFILGSIFILVANAYYIFVSVPPDGRWKIQFPLTSFFVLFYLVLFFFISRKLLKNPKYNYLLWTYNLLLAFLFLGNCGGVQQSFRHVEFMYAFQYISMAPYLVILGAGIVVYALLISYLENGRKFREVILNRKIIISFVMVFIFFLGVAMPKVMNFDSLQDSVQKNYYARLENAYASQQAHIFFDNPFERMFIMKTVVTDISPDTKRLIVNAYTFFNFKYKTIEIERVSEEAMARMLGREFKQKISRIGKDIPEILKRIQHSQWPRVTYSELIKNNYFSPEKIQGIIPGINNTNSLFLQTDFDEHEVYLLVYLEDLYTNTMKKDFAFKNGESRLEYIYKFKDIKISKANQIATLYSYRIEYDGHPYYIIFDVISDQEMPADVDYIWRPDHNIKDDDIEQVLRSIAGLLKEYFDDNLKMSFKYPNNFYIENGSIGSNFDIVVTPFTPDNPDYNNPNIVK